MPIVLEGKSITIFATLLALAIALYYTYALWRRRRRQRPDEREVAICCMGWTMGLGTWLGLDPVFLWVGQISHIPNLAWLLVHLCLIFGLYCAAVTTVKSFDAALHLKRLTQLAAFMMVVLTVVFFGGGIAFTPPIFMRTPVHSLSELIGIGLVYTYNTALLCKILLMAIHMIKNDKVRLRALLLAGVLVSGVIYSILRIILPAAMYYSWLDSSDAYRLQAVILVVFTIFIVGWPIVFVPARWWDILPNWWRLYHLNYLYWRVRNTCEQPITAAALPRGREQIRRARFYIEAIIVFVLDIKRLLERQHLTLSDPAVWAGMESLNDSLPYDQLVAACVAQGRYLRRRDRRSANTQGEVNAKVQTNPRGFQEQV